MEKTQIRIAKVEISTDPLCFQSAEKLCQNTNEWDLGYARDFINISSRRTTGFHRQARLFEVNFFIRKTFHQMFKPGQQNHHHSLSICPVPGPQWNLWYTSKSALCTWIKSSQSYIVHPYSCSFTGPGGGEGVLPTYGLYSYVLQNRLWFLRFSVLK